MKIWKSTIYFTETLGSRKKMVIFRKFFAEQSENNVARRILRQMNTVIRNSNVRRLLSFFTIGRILNVVLLINDNHKVSVICYRNDAR